MADDLDREWASMYAEILWAKEVAAREMLWPTRVPSDPNPFPRFHLFRRGAS